MGESQRDRSSQWGEKGLEAAKAAAGVAFQKQFTYPQPCRFQIGDYNFFRVMKLSHGY